MENADKFLNRNQILYIPYGVWLIFAEIDIHRNAYLDADIFLTDPGRILSIGEWLEENGLGQYENTLVANGFDHTDFLVSCSSDLNLWVSSPTCHCQKKKTRSVPFLGKWSVADSGFPTMSNINASCNIWVKLMWISSVWFLNIHSITSFSWCDSNSVY